jgi:mRNA interferase RelE/StbE
MLCPVMDEPVRVGGLLRCELAGLRAARRGAYRVTYEVDEDDKVVNVVRIDHRATAYRAR